MILDFHKLIRDAQAGNIGSLVELYKKLTPSNYTLAALDAALAHLTLDGAPTPQADIQLIQRRVERARDAISILPVAAEYCLRSETVKKATISRIHETLDGIITWMHLVVRLSDEDSDPFSSQQLLVELFQRIASLDPLLKLTIYSSRRTLDLLLIVWEGKLGDSGEKSKAFVEVKVLQFMAALMESSDGSDLIQTSLLESPSLAKCLFNGLQARLVDFKELLARCASNKDRDCYLQLIGIITVQLAQQPAMDIHFRTPVYLRSWLDVACSPELRLDRHELLFQAQSILLFADRSRSRPAVDFREIAMSGLIPLLAECFTAGEPKWEAEDLKTGYDVLHMLKTYAHFPNVLIPLVSALGEYHEQHPLTFPNPDAENAEAQREWQAFIMWALFLKRSISLGNLDEETGNSPVRPSPQICDNELVSVFTRAGERVNRLRRLPT